VFEVRDGVLDVGEDIAWLKEIVGVKPEERSWRMAIGLVLYVSLE
jgi:hypothetical protein